MSTSYCVSIIVIFLFPCLILLYACYLLNLVVSFFSSYSPFFPLTHFSCLLFLSENFLVHSYLFAYSPSLRAKNLYCLGSLNFLSIPSSLFILLSSSDAFFPVLSFLFLFLGFPFRTTLVYLSKPYSSPIYLLVFQSFPLNPIPQVLKYRPYPIGPEISLLPNPTHSSLRQIPSFPWLGWA